MSIDRIYGSDAIGTSIAVSEAEFPSSDSAKAVVLARSDFFSDALAGGPLAAKVGGPLLITPGASTSSILDSRVLNEIKRVLAPGGTVYILGGDLALSSGIDAELEFDGYTTQRLAGADEYGTAIDIAEQLGNPSTIFEATGLNFPDALSAVPAAIEKGGAILLTDGSSQDLETAEYLSAHSGDTRYAIGGPLAAYGADPTATPVYGQDLFGTSAAVATTFFPAATAFGAATGATFPDALSGGVFMGTLAKPGPVVLVNPSGPLPPSIDSYLTSAAKTLTNGYLFGGPAAVDDGVESELENPPAPTPLAVTTSSLPGATSGTPYSQSLGATAGSPPYSWSLVSGALPPGLTLSSTGLIAGTPSGAGTFGFTVQVADSSSPTPQTTSASLSITVSAPTNVSDNWSGYEELGNSFTYVTGTFTVPSLSSGASTDEADTWVGIDGANNSSLIQAGVGEYYDADDPNYFYIYPWWEILPASQTLIATVAVNVGDEITVTIGVVSGDVWGITLTDDTNGETYTTDQVYSGPETSAEWIVEAPVVNGSLVQLAPYTPDVSFTNLGFSATPTETKRDVMVQNGVQVSTPSEMGANGFNVAYGSSEPSASPIMASPLGAPAALIPKSNPPRSLIPSVRSRSPR